MSMRARRHRGGPNEYEDGEGDGNQREADRERRIKQLSTDRPGPQDWRRSRSSTKPDQHGNRCVKSSTIEREGVKIDGFGNALGVSVFWRGRVRRLEGCMCSSQDALRIWRWRGQPKGGDGRV